MRDISERIEAHIAEVKRRNPKVKMSVVEVEPDWSRFFDTLARISSLAAIPEAPDGIG